MRAGTLFVGLVVFSSQAIAGPKSFEEAWRYVSAPGKSDRWIVVTSPKNDGYFQCENMDEVVRCVVPVWIRTLPSPNNRVLPFAGREKPYPDVPGSELEEYLDRNAADKAKSIMEEFGLEPSYVYSQVKNEDLKVVGTQCDIRGVIEFSFKGFETLAKEYLRRMFGITSKDGYEFETD